MDKEKLKLIVRNLKSLVDVLESEIYSDRIIPLKDQISPPTWFDYDEVFEDDE